LEFLNQHVRDHLEIKAGTSQVEANAPGTVIFDNFLEATP
jgi:hypothetical protein